MFSRLNLEKLCSIQHRKPETNTELSRAQSANFELASSSKINQGFETMAEIQLKSNSNEASSDPKKIEVSLMDFLTEQIDEFLLQSSAQDMMSMSNLEQKVESICKSSSVAKGPSQMKNQTFGLFNSNISHLKLPCSKASRKTSDESTAYSESSQSNIDSIPQVSILSYFDDQLVANDLL